MYSDKAKHDEAKKKPAGKDKHDEAKKKPAGKDKHDEATKKPAGKDKHDEATKKPAGKDKKCLNWGVVPITKLAHDFAAALRTLPNNEHKVMSCTSPYRSEAQQFADKNGIPIIFTCFEDFAKCPECDVAYISSEKHFNFELANMMIRHGKHVLIERPMGLNERQAKLLICRAKKQGRFIMEGMWPRFTPAYAYIKERIDGGAVGKVIGFDCSLGWDMQQDEHVMKRKTGGGVTTELGGYAVQMALWAFRAPPVNIEATGKLNDDGVDVETEIEITFDSDRCAKIILSATEELENSATIEGENGTMIVPEFWCPTTLTDTDGSTKDFDLPDAPETKLKKRIAMRYEAQEMRRCIMEEEKQSKLYDHKETLLVARILDEVRKQIGVKYDVDK